jgi:protein transport protein HofQ/type IV pilus assembly protein PilQ
MKRLSVALALALACAVCAPSAFAAQARISLDVRDADLFDVLRLVSMESGLNIVADGSVKHDRVTLRLQDVGVERVLSILAQAYDLQVRREDGITFVGSTTSASGHYLGGAPATLIALRYARSADAVKQLAGVLPERSYALDERQNAILVNGTSRTIATARSFLHALDVPAPQIMFEVRVVDLTVSDNSDIGVLYAGSGTNDGPGSVAWAFKNKTIPIQAQLNALVTQNRAKVLATPRLATLNNKEASLLVGQSYPISNTVTVGTTTSSDVKFVDIGVRLRLTPTIGADGSIVAELHPEYSAFSGSSPQGNPIISNRKIDTTLRIEKDETIVLGGLIQETDRDTIRKLPLLGDLPIIGPVFRNRERGHEKDDIVFLITPHVI